MKIFHCKKIICNLFFVFDIMRNKMCSPTLLQAREHILLNGFEDVNSLELLQS